MKRALLAIFLLFWTALPGAAQDNRVWIQIAARPSLDQAQAVLRAQNSQLQGLHVVHMKSDWYAVVLGPFSAATGQAELARLRAQGRIPADSYLGRRDDYRREFLDIGPSVLGRNAPMAARQPGPMVVAAPDPSAITESALPPDGSAPDGLAPDGAAPDAAAMTDTSAVTETAVGPDTAPATGTGAGMDTGAAADSGAMAAIGTPASLDETPSEARASEARLSETARKDLQRALAWFGVYTSAIDGDIGPGTRAAMAEWQARRGEDATGVLTARQRAELLNAFRDDIAALGLEPVTSDAAGITIDLPKGVVRYEGTDAPFVRYKGDGPDPARVVLISQAGGADRLKALYEVLQTLAIVPEGARARLRGGGFTIDGATEAATTHIEAALYGQTIKGFALVWPKSAPGDPARVAEAMSAGFVAMDGAVLPEDAGNPADQNVDLMAGLRIRRPDWTRSGVYIDATGRAVTLARGIDACGTLTIGEGLQAAASALGTSGLALVTPATPAAPLETARFREAPGRIGSAVTLALYPLGDRVAAPSITFGTLADIRSPGGDPAGMRLTVPGRLGDSGGPILDATGALLGIVAPPAEGGVTPPATVARGIGAPAIAAALRADAIEPAPATATGTLTPEAAAAAASDMTALISCWN